MSPIDRRAFLRFMGLGAGSLFLGGYLTGCGRKAVETVTPDVSGAGSDAQKPLRIGYLPITDAAPLLLAHARGFYEDEGLAVEHPYLFRGWSQIIEAFIAGQVDVIHVLMPAALWMRFGSGVRSKIVAWNHTDGSALTVGHDVDTVEDLGGQIVAIPYWYSVHNVVLQQLLHHHDLKVADSQRSRIASDEVRLVIMAPPDMPAALANGSIAGYIVAEPFNATAETMGIGKILRFTGDIWLRHACCVVVMKEDDLAKRPAWSQSVITAIVKAQKWARENREEAAIVLSQDGSDYLPQPKEPIVRTLTYYDHDHYGQGEGRAIVHPEWGNSRIDFLPYPYPSYTEALIRFLKTTHVEGERSFLDTLRPEDGHNLLVDDTFVKAAIEQVGGMAAFGLPEDYTRDEVFQL